MGIFSKKPPKTPAEEILDRLQGKAQKKKSGGVRKWFLVTCTALGIVGYTQRDNIAQYVETQTTAITEDFKQSLKEKAPGLFDAKKPQESPAQAHIVETPKALACTPAMPRQINGEIKKPAPQVIENLDQVFMFNQAARRLNDTGVIKHGNMNINYTNVGDWYEMIGRSEKLMQSPQNQKLWQDWLAQFSNLKDADLETKLKTVDAAVDSAVRYELDVYTVGRSEYYSSPIETLKKRQGDCDDFAILKYMTLKALGVNEASMFMLSVDWEGKGSVDHAILAVSLDGNPPNLQSKVVLLNNDGEGLLIPVSEKPEITPYMAMNGQQGLFAFPALYKSL